LEAIAWKLELEALAIAEFAQEGIDVVADPPHGDPLLQEIAERHARSLSAVLRRLEDSPGPLGAHPDLHCFRREHIPHGCKVSA
jgi:hypothetical protein